VVRMTKIEVGLFVIGAGLLIHGVWTFSPAVAEIVGGLFLIGAAAPTKGAKE
jgi:hypothetical protein